MSNEEAYKIVKLSDSEFDYFTKLVSQTYGIDLSQKRHLIEARLASELKAHGLQSFSQYIDILKADKTSKILESVINKLSTNYSFFSRETDHFDYLAKTVIPEMDRLNKRTIKIWSAGCSTGQEPYNIAMAIDSALGFKKSLWSIAITATDISTDALAVASKGVYPESSLDVMPAPWKSTYMSKLPDGNFQVASSIRNMVSFKKFNLMDPFPYSNYYDVIFCRNVMIYFKPQTAQQIVNKFYQANTAGGYFFISHSETINRFNNEYTYLFPSIYRKQK
ncbi:MAG: protein-glutamate O-methyltransferase CheR [Oscillospiraceae bacterium]|nr:protein-glutamate O-methyltransferase CheR [Oscillospiraceae bacterium]